MTRRPWWEQHPQRWTDERAALHKAGARFRFQRPKRHDPPGLKRLRVSWPLPPNVEELTEQTHWDLDVIFPTAYPWFAPHVSLRTPEPGLARHRNPKSGGLCLLADPDRQWHPETLLSDLLRMQLPRVIAANSTGDRERLASLEEPEIEGARIMVGEPLGAVSILVDTQMPTPTTPTGTAQVLVLRRPDGGVILAVEGFDDKPSQPPVWTSWRHAKSTTIERYTLGRELTPEDNPESIWNEVAQAGNRSDRNALDLCVVAFRDEVAYRRFGTNLMLLVRSKTTARSKSSYEWALAQPAGKADLAPRQTARGELANKSVVIVGTGAIGHAVALNLGRVGVGRMTLFDGDTTEADTSPRQTHALTAGMAKVSAVALIVGDYAPHCDIRTWPIHIGSTMDPGLLESVIPDADLIIDCAASPALTRYISMRARKAEINVLVRLLRRPLTLHWPASHFVVPTCPARTSPDKTLKALTFGKQI